jgi:hypothetical protein
MTASIRGPACHANTIMRSTYRCLPVGCSSSGFFLTLYSGLARMRLMGAPVPCLRTRGGRPFDEGLLHDGTVSVLAKEHRETSGRRAFK